MFLVVGMFFRSRFGPLGRLGLPRLLCGLVGIVWLVWLLLLLSLFDVGHLGGVGALDVVDGFVYFPVHVLPSHFPVCVVFDGLGVGVC